ncbi:hypothetical protein HKBW3S43_00629 [Candidatus Hakubella thermalkaliphila]|uniref:Polysaccharide biosynthesis protein C-terminal domain-containing protein n=1 Tax=Candidatus Hakubella thermalkaliphila TaxID=2754717 RepID=A0A6V8PRE6_9ACTN|nr:oligosaccharide flippase family protein [Candidatus Hakubella thermalkaliphila]GFP34837.1 hypothetical protein HKBW3S43_00629 [Candidatus Hakubella thermalkaliphila]
MTEEGTIAEKQLNLFHRVFSAVKSDELARQFSLMFVATMVANFLNYVYNLIMGRMLGPADFSAFTALLSVLLIASAIGGTIQTVVTRHVSILKSERKFNSIYHLLVKSARPSLVASLFLLLVFVLLSPPAQTFLRLSSVTPMLVLGTVVAVSLVAPIPWGILLGLQDYRNLAVLMILGGMLRLVSGVLLVFVGFAVSGALGASALAGLVALFFAVLPIRPLKNSSSDCEPVPFLDMFKYSMPVMISIVCFLGLITMDMVLVRHFFEAEDAGHYAAAATLGKIVLFLPGAISLVMFPKTSELKVVTQKSLKIFYKSLLTVFILSGAVTLGYFLFPTFIVSIMFGQKYLFSVPYIGFFGIAMTFFALVSVFISYLLSVKKQGLIYFLLVAAFLEAGLIWLFHDTFYQVLSILIGVSIALFISLCLYLYLSSKRGSSIGQVQEEVFDNYPRL